MIDYQTFCEIKRMHKEENMTPHKIGKILGIDEKTASRWLARDRFSKKTGVRRTSVIKPGFPEIVTIIK